MLFQHRNVDRLEGLRDSSNSFLMKEWCDAMAVGRQNQNVEDRQRQRRRVRRRLGRRHAPNIPMGGGRRAGGIGGLALIVIVVLALIFGFDPGLLLQGDLGRGPTYPSATRSTIQAAATVN